GKLIFRQAVGYGCHGSQGGGRVGTQGNRNGKRLARVGEGMIAEVQRTTTVRQPAHDELVAPQYLLPVDAQVLPACAWAPGDDQPPREQRCNIPWPAVLYGQRVQIHVGPFDYSLLTRRLAYHAGIHVPEGRLEHGNLAQG